MDDEDKIKHLKALMGDDEYHDAQELSDILQRHLDQWIERYDEQTVYAGVITNCMLRMMLSRGAAEIIHLIDMFFGVAVDVYSRIDETDPKNSENLDPK